MQTLLSEEQLAFQEAVRDFCRRELGSREQLDAYTDSGRAVHSPAFYDKVGATGYLGVNIPEEYGGSGGGLLEQCLLMEELWRGRAPVHGAGSSHTVAGIYKRYGTEEQKKATLAAIASGTVVSISVSEPEAGSDAANIACRAEQVPGGYRINGQKTWCSDAQFARLILLVARTERGERPHAGLTMFEVSTDSPGLEIRPIATMGGNEVNDVFYTDVFVPDECVVGEAGRGWAQLMAGLNGERLVCAFQGLGMCQRTFDDLLAYVKERKQFGQPIGTFQALRHRIADLAIEIEASRALTYTTAFRVQHNAGSPEELVRLTSMAKVKVTQTATHAALEGIQMMGGYGYASEYGMEQHLRTAIPATIYSGTNEIQREIISSTFGLRT